MFDYQSEKCDYSTNTSDKVIPIHVFVCSLHALHLGDTKLDVMYAHEQFATVTFMIASTECNKQNIIANHSNAWLIQRMYRYICSCIKLHTSIHVNFFQGFWIELPLICSTGQDKIVSTHPNSTLILLLTKLALRGS